MNTESREHLSCLMDGEVSRETGRFLVRRLGSDADLCATWARYHLVRDCLRHHEGSLAGDQLYSRVRKAIDDEAAPKSRQAFARRWLKPAAGAAIAASVALVAVLAVGPARQNALPTADHLSERGDTPAFTSPQSLTPPPVSQQASLSGAPARDSRMSAYLLRHYQAAGQSGNSGFVALVPIVVTQAATTAEGREAADGDGTADGDNPASPQ